MSSQEQAHERDCHRYRFGTAEFDEESFELWVSGLRVDIERRALDVLAYLLRHAGEVVTKEELFREVWAGRITVEKVLPNAITKLRRALGEVNGQQLTTLPRVGYRLEGVVERVSIERPLISWLELRAGQPVPMRAQFLLQRQLGSHPGNEVWLAGHVKTGELRVFKFATEPLRLRALKREVTLSRLLHESLDDARYFVEILDWNFETQPFFIESRFAGRNLLDWAQSELASATVDQRLDLFLQIADAVAQAHAIGVLHKDLKPANVLVDGDGEGRSIRLTDFGSGRLLQPERLDQLGISQFDATLTQTLSTDGGLGTLLYVAPEVIGGQASTVQSDVFALGVMLYQLLAGDLKKPIAPGWEQDVDDALLCEDIRLATDGNPARRLSSAGELGLRLRSRTLRAEQARLAREAAREAQQARYALTRSRARRPYLIALVATLAAALVATLGLYRSTLRARDEAQRELNRANALNLFLNNDLINQSNPFVAAKGANASLKDTLIAARDCVVKRFSHEPITEASIHGQIGLLLTAIDQLPEAEGELARALTLYERESGIASADAMKTRADLARVQARMSKFAAVSDQIKTFQRVAAESRDAYARYLLAAVSAVYYSRQGEFEKAIAEQKTAMQLRPSTESAAVQSLERDRLYLASWYRLAGHAQESRREAAALVHDLEAGSEPNELLLTLAKQHVAEADIEENHLDAAAAELAQVQESVLRLVGAEHEINLQVLQDFLEIAAKQKDWPQVIAYSREMNTLFIKKFGEEHTLSSVTLGNWGEALFKAGQAQEAEAKLETAYRRLHARLPADNPYVAAAAFWLAADEIDLGKPAKADALLASINAADLTQSDASAAWPARVDALRGLALLERGDKIRANAVLTDAVAGMEAKGDAADIVYERAKSALAGAGTAVAQQPASVPNRSPY